jgi:MerR family transcriptional regulator, Zn(II)-responsive regulator of zntA
LAPQYQIGEVATRLGVSVDTIRFYEKISLMKASARSILGYRLYTEDDIQILQSIREFKASDFSLQEIRQLLGLRRHPSRACSHVREILGKKLSQIKQKIGGLEMIEAELSRNWQNCNRALESPSANDALKCPVFAKCEA